MIINASPRFPAFVSLTIHAQAQKFFLAYALFIIALVKSQTVEKSYHFLHARFLERSKLLWAYKEATSFPAHLIPESMVLDRRWVCENGDYRDGDGWRCWIRTWQFDWETNHLPFRGSDLHTLSPPYQSPLYIDDSNLRIGFYFVVSAQCIMGNFQNI